MATRTRTRKPRTPAEKVRAWWHQHGAAVQAKWPLAALGLLAFYVSFGHIRYVTAQHIDEAHNLPGVPYIMPVIIDVMIIACARYATKSPTTSGRLLALVGFALAMLASLTANMMASAPTLWSRVWSTWPAVALLIVAAVSHFAGHKALSAAAIARRVRDRQARKLARKGVTPELDAFMTANRGRKATTPVRATRATRTTVAPMVGPTSGQLWPPPRAAVNGERWHPSDPYVGVER